MKSICSNTISFQNHSYLNYNGKTVRRSSALPESTADTFGFAKTGADSAHYVGHRSYGDILDAVIDPFVDALEKDISTYPATHDGWDKLMASDAYSTRGYLATQKVPLDSQNPNLDQLTIDWLETMDKSTGWYDRSFAETVLEQMCFAKNNKDAKWWCEDGGSSKIAEAMASLLETRPTLNTQVTKIEANSTLGVDPPGMTVTVAGGGQFDFSHVVSTLPLPVLRTLDIDNVGLTVKQTNALRQLQYGPAEKIGVLFSSQWWNDNKVISKIDNQPINIQGGQSSTDRCIRTVVYPSYGPNGSSSSNALIASYGWTADATRFAGLFGNDDASKARLKDLVLRDLAAVHGVDQKVLEAVFVDIYPWEWSQSPFAQGAYAFFGPGQFSELYRCLTKPIAKGSFHIAGEAISPRHAWVVGALDSAWRAVYSIVLRDYPELKDKFKDLWGQNMEWTASPTFQKVYTHEDLLAVHLAIHAPDVYKL
ncbi:hypothetical protein FRC03_004675 [Tulasnella sp. 419]|nr:hypothetical protein FRC03_004675 [Tulasnella sp. 419]